MEKRESLIHSKGCVLIIRWLGALVIAGSDVLIHPINFI